MTLSPHWHTTTGLILYPDALTIMERRVEEIRKGTSPDILWRVEHPPLYTAGTSAVQRDLLTPERFPVYSTGRGGQYTYHGPGQRVIYVMLDLRRHGQDVRCFVRTLERWIIAVLAHFGLEGFIREGRVGVWVNTPRGEEKIAAIGIRVRRWITFHGLALNVNPTLEHFSGIVPCGLGHFGVTSLHALGIPASMNEVDAVFEETMPFDGRKSLSCANL